MYKKHNHMALTTLDILIEKRVSYRRKLKIIFLKYVNKPVTIAREHRVSEIAYTMRADGFRNNDNYLYRNNHASNSTYIKITIDGYNDWPPNYNL